MKESYCGLCDKCQLDNPELKEALVKVKNHVERFPIYFWRHCFLGEEGFSFTEFLKALNWFLGQHECPGCKMGGGLKGCPIRDCAQQRQVARCSVCPDEKKCDLLNSYKIKSWSEDFLQYSHRNKRFKSI